MQHRGRRIVAVAVVLILALLMTGAEGADPLASLEDFLRFLANPVSLGIVSSLALQVLRRLKPAIDERWAFLASVGFAVLAALIGTLLLPLAPTWPAELQVYWPIVVWFFSQVWFWIMKDQIALYVSTRSVRG